MKRTITSLLLPGLLAAAAPSLAQQIAPASGPSAHDRTIAAGYKALMLCEGLFSAGRTEAQIEAVELRGIYPEYQPLLPALAATIEPASRAVSVAFDDKLKPRRAEHSPGIGCALAPVNGDRPFRAGLDPHTAIPLPAVSKPWPAGDDAIAPQPSPALAGRIAAAFDGASHGGGVTTGVVIVRDGRIVGERYADGFGPLVSNRTWSVAKSIAGTLIGVAVHQGLIDPMAAATIPEWWLHNDPRQEITLDQLLRMASGLYSDTPGNRTDPVYFGGVSVTERTVGWPLDAPPGTRFRYANNDTLLAIRALRASIGNDDRYHPFPRSALFSRIGMEHTTTGVDPHGNFILSSQVWSTARDLARLGLLWLNDGVWEGERILPEGWMRYMTTPTGPQPAGDGPRYGATLWLFGPAQGLPEGSYAAQGNRGQFVMVVPSRRLVLVRRGEDPSGARFDIAGFTRDVLAALD